MMGSGGGAGCEFGEWVVVNGKAVWVWWGKKRSFVVRAAGFFGWLGVGGGVCKYICRLSDAKGFEVVAKVM